MQYKLEETGNRKQEIENEVSLKIRLQENKQNSLLQEFLYDRNLDRMIET